MANSYGSNERTERLVLAGLPFVGKKQADFVMNPANPIALVRSEMRRVYKAELAALDAAQAAAARKTSATPKSAITDAPRARLSHPILDASAAQSASDQAAQRERIERDFRVGDFSPDNAGKVTHKGNYQYFGRPPSGTGGR